MASATSETAARQAAWPDIAYEPWRETCVALHLFTQVVGKYRLARTPWLNHSWHATLYVTARGLSSSLVPDKAGDIEVLFDFVDQSVIAQASDGAIARFPLEPMSVAEFHARFVRLIGSVGGTPEFHGRPNEVAEPVAFTDDIEVRPYDARAVRNFHAALVSVQRVLQEFRTGFIGKVSPVHLFWGSFDLAVTRFSGRPAPVHPGGIPALPDEVTREAYSHEVSSAGFWPGGGPIDVPAFYSYGYPVPAGFADAKIEPAAAYWDAGAGEFILPYDSVRNSPRPEQTLLLFLESTYAAAATLGRWDRAALECPSGEPLRPRPLYPPAPVVAARSRPSAPTERKETAMKMLPFILLLPLLTGPASAQVLSDMAKLTEETGLLRKQSPHSVAVTAERFEAAVRDRGMKVFPLIDHAAAAREAGLEMRPTVVVPFGKPKYGTPLMEMRPSVAIDLPPKVAIYQAADGQVWIEYNSAAYFYGTILARHGFEYTPQEMAEFTTAVEALTDFAVKPGT